MDMKKIEAMAGAIVSDMVDAGRLTQDEAAETVVRSKRWCVVFRTGGLDNFRWMRSATLDTKAEAVALRDKLERAGYKAYDEEYELSMRVGLPETFEYEEGELLA